MKRIISLVAVVAMVFSLCALNVSAKNEKIIVDQEVSCEGTVAPGGQIVITFSDFFETTENGYVAYPAINTNFHYDPTLTFVGAAGYNESLIQYWRLANDTEYSEIAFDHAYNTPVYQDAGKVVMMSYTLTFDVPADAAIGTVYEFNYTYGGNGGILYGDKDLTQYIDTCEISYTEEPSDVIVSVTVAEEIVEEPAVAPAAAKQEVRLGCEACEVSAGIRFISSIDTAAAGADLEGYGIEITYNNVTKDVPAVNVYKTEGRVVYFTAVITNAPAGATFVAQPYADYADGRVYATAGANA